MFSSGIGHKYKVVGKVSKSVHCESCGGDYSYQLQQPIEICCCAHKLSRDDAAAQPEVARAKALLESKLLCVPAPFWCPLCGHYQRSMVGQLRINKAMAALATTCCLALGTFLVGRVLSRQGLELPLDLPASAVQCILVVGGLCTFYVWNQWNPNGAARTRRMAGAEAHRRGQPAANAEQLAEPPSHRSAAA
jgi:hypothetical protein